MSKYHDRKEQGLCVQCGMPFDNGKVRCDACTKDKSDYNKNRYAFLKLMGRCTRCGKKTQNGCPTCECCKIKNRDRMRRAYGKGKALSVGLQDV